MEESTELTEQISKSLETWTIITSYNLALILLLVGAFLYLAKGFYLDSRRYYRFNVSRDNWSILMNLIKDFSLFASFGISLLLLNPDMMADVKLPLPFFPLGVVLLGIALIYKTRGDLTQNQKAQILFSLFLILSLVAQYLGFVFVMEAAPAEWVERGIASDFWLSLRHLRSNLNPELTMWSFAISFPLLMLIVVLMIWQSLRAKFYVEDETEQTNFRKSNKA